MTDNIEKTIMECVIKSWNERYSKPTVPITTLITQALFSSPSIAIVERERLNKMERVIEAAKNHALLSVDVADFVFKTAKLQEALTDLEVEE